MPVRAVLLVTVVVVLCQLPTTVFSQCEINCADPLCSRYPGGCGTACKTGYGIDLTTHTCKSCSNKCTGTCNTCGPGKCDRNCITGYSWSSSICDCVLCATNCYNCSLNGYLKCNPGGCNASFAFYETDKVCHPCDEHCGPVGCSRPYTCKAGGCISPYINVPLSVGSTDYTCEYTPPNCGLNCNGTCLGGGPGFCDGPCGSGYKLCRAVNVPDKCACYPDRTDCTVCANNCTVC